MDFNFARNHKGFTLVEIIAILVIIGLLSIFAASRITIDNTDLLTTQAALKTHLRHTQSKAMQSTTTIRGIRFDTALDEYWFFECSINTSCSWTGGRTLPFGAEASSTNFNNDRIKTSLADIDISQITVGSDSHTRLTLIFNEMGVPFWLGNSSITFVNPLENSTGITRLTENITIQLTDTSGNTADLVIAGETGFIQ